jgi:hypothetical protein
VPHTFSDLRKIERIGASTELGQVLNDLEADSFDGMTTGEI